MMSVIFYYYLLLQCVIGAVLIVNNWEGYNWEMAGITDQSVRVFGYWAIMYTMIAFPFGMLLANSVFKKTNTAYLFRKYCAKPITLERIGDSNLVRILLIALSIISLLSVIYVIGIIGEIGILKVMNTDSASELKIFRNESGREFSGNVFIRGVFALYLCPILCYVAYAYRIYKPSSNNTLWFWSMFVGSVLILTSNLEKAPVIIFFIGFVFFRVYLGKPLSKKLLTILALIVFFLVALIYIFVMKTETEFIAKGIMTRLTVSSVGGLYLDLDIFPSKHPFLGFSSFSTEISSIFGPQSDRSARIAMMMVRPEQIALGAGVINCLFIGEAWANWGWPGLILSPIYVGFLIQSFYLFLLSLRKTPLLLGIMVKYSFYAAIVGGINDYIYNTAVRCLTIIVVLFWILAQLSRLNIYAHTNRISGHTDR